MRKETCGRCGGSGEDKSEWDEVCRVCDGSGTTTRNKSQAMLVFDSGRANKAAEQGIDAAKQARAELFILACDIAERIARERGEVTMDDVQARLIELGHHPRDLGPAAGAIFRNPKKWGFVRMTKSKRVSNHGSDLRVWRLREGWSR